MCMSLKKLRVCGGNACLSLQPNLTTYGEILVRMVSCGMVGMTGVIGWGHSNDKIGACIAICFHVDLHVNVCGSAQCCECMINDRVAME